MSSLRADSAQQLYSLYYRMEKYCSRECQRASWPEHKHRCGSLTKYRQSLIAQPEPGQKADRDLFNTVYRWNLLWGAVLYEYGVMGMNLAEFPERLDTHAYVHLSIHFLCCIRGTLSYIAVWYL